MWRLLCALFCFVMLLPASFSQNLRLEKVNAENFPELQVFIHDRNPESTDNANIILSENTQKLNAEDYKISYIRELGVPEGAVLPEAGPLGGARPLGGPFQALRPGKPGKPSRARQD